MQCDRDIGDAQRTPDHQHDHHRHDRPPQPAQDACTAVAEGQQAVEQCRRVGLLHTERDDIRLTAERADEPWRQRVDAHTHDLGHQHRAERAELHPFAHAVGLTGTDILADEGRQRHRKAGHGQKSKALDLAVGTAPGHGLRTERVDVGLHDDIGNRDDRVLDAGRQALHNDCLEGWGVKSDLVPMHSPFLFAVGQLGKGQNGADRLGGNRGKGGRTHAHAQPADQNQVENDIDDGRGDQIPHRAFAVTDRLQDACTYIVHDHGDRAEEVHPEVGDRVGQHAVRCAHPAQDLRRQYYAHHGERHTGGNAQCHCGVDGAAHPVPVLSAEIPRHHHAGAQRDAVDKARQQKDQAAGRADGGQGLAAQKVADDQGVGGVIQLLKQVADKNRQRKQQHTLGNAALYQRCFLFRFHSLLSLYPYPERQSAGAYRMRPYGCDS